MITKLVRYPGGAWVGVRDGTDKFGRHCLLGAARVVCPDGRLRIVCRLSEADFVLPIWKAAVRVKGKTVTGIVLISRAFDKPVLKFLPYANRKNAGAFD